MYCLTCLYILLHSIMQNQDFPVRYAHQWDWKYCTELTLTLIVIFLIVLFISWPTHFSNIGTTAASSAVLKEETGVLCVCVCFILKIKFVAWKVIISNQYNHSSEERLNVCHIFYCRTQHHLGHIFIGLIL
jgi:hypothetical protein